MKRFVVTYHASDDAVKQMQNVPADQQAEGMKQWHVWAEKCGDHLVDLGTPLTPGRKIDTDGRSQESNREVIGYSILQAENMDEALDLLKDHPHLSGWSNSCEIEVHEALPLPG